MEYFALMARPIVYTAEIGLQIAERISNGEPVKSLCKDETMPSVGIFYKWLNVHSEFQELYARSKEEQIESLVEDMLSIADDGTNDWNEVFDKDGQSQGWRLNAEHVQRSRVRIDTRKWLASKLKPKKYGDRQTVEMNVNVTLSQRLEAAEKLIDVSPDISKISAPAETIGIIEHTFNEAAEEILANE